MSNLVEVRNLNVKFSGERTVYAVNDLSFSLGEGEIQAVVNRMTEFTRGFQCIRHQILNIESADRRIGQRGDPFIHCRVRQLATLGATPKGVRGLNQPEARCCEQSSVE